jgi:threonine/homoserine/homoserine lactone efflux protein
LAAVLGGLYLLWLGVNALGSKRSVSMADAAADKGELRLFIKSCRVTSSS